MSISVWRILASSSSLVQCKEYAMSLKQRQEKSNKFDEGHIFLDFNDSNDSIIPSKRGSTSTIIANPTRTDDYFQLYPPRLD